MVDVNTWIENLKNANYMFEYSDHVMLANLLKNLKSEIEKLRYMLVDVANQCCSVVKPSDKYPDFSLSTQGQPVFEDIIEYLVSIDRAKWVKGKEGFIAKWNKKEDK